MRRLVAPCLLAFATLLLLSCSKSKSSDPVAPPDPSPACALSTTALDFGTVAVGSSADKQFTLTNSGGGTLSGSITDTSSVFQIIGTAGYQLGAGQSKAFTVRFAPARTGAANVYLLLNSSGCGTVICTGTGQSNAPQCEINGTSIDFGAVPWGSTDNRQFQVLNHGGGSLWAVVRGDHGDFLVDSTEAYYVLEPGWSAWVGVSFTPTFTGTQRCTLSVGENAGCEPIVLQGTGYFQTYGFCSAAPNAPDTVDFGQVGVGQSKELAYSIVNQSSGYWAKGVLLNHSREFEFSDDFFFNMPPGASQTGHIRFSPSFAGGQYCAMAISCEEVGSGLTPGVQKYVVCKGVGVGTRAAAAAPTRSLPAMPPSVGRVLRGLPPGARSF